MDFEYLNFNHKSHRKYLLKILSHMPPFLSSMDTHRVLLAYFAVSGLDLLNELESIIDKQKIIDWIYSMQVSDLEDTISGFQGSTTFNIDMSNNWYKCGHIAATYSALATLVILGDDLSRVNRDAIIKSLKSLQLEDGCYKGAKDGTESDMRFVFCAACISYILDDWSGMDIDKTVEFILNSMSYDFGIAQVPHMESHSGSTFCAVATLSLSKQLHRLSTQQREGVIRWLLSRCEFGFTGRPNKPSDTCYAFWTGGALHILDAYRFLDSRENAQYVLATQHSTGGLSKWINSMPDPMHTYLGLGGLSLMGQHGIAAIFPDLNVSQRAHQHLLEIHKQWRQ